MSQSLDQILVSLKNMNDPVIFAEAKAQIAQAVDEIIGGNDGQLLALRFMKPYKNERNRKAQ